MKSFSSCAGHAKTFQIDQQGRLLKRHNATTANEMLVYQMVADRSDAIGDFTSNFYGTRTEDGKLVDIRIGSWYILLGIEYCVMDNLLDGFDAPAVMDIKVIIALRAQCRYAIKW